MAKFSAYNGNIIYCDGKFFSAPVPVKITSTSAPSNPQNYYAGSVWVQNGNKAYVRGTNSSGQPVWND